MAPLPDSSPFSSIVTFVKRTQSHILPRSTVDPAAGVTPPTSIPNKAIFALFGLIGVGFVLTGIWFFFWAKNGGIYFSENDWEDYKSTVLRRKGPNGTTLSGATESTDLGGGSVVHGEKYGRGKKKQPKWKKGHKGGSSRYKDFEEDAGSSITGSSEMSELKFKAKDAHKKRAVGDEEADDDVVEDAVRAYRHEKPARVGGINAKPDGSSWGGSTDHSDLLSNREKTPTNTPTRIKKERRDNYTGGTGGIRKVESTSGGSSSGFWNRSGSNKKPVEEDRIKAEAQKLQEKGRAAQRRDFSFQTGDDASVDDDRRAAREAREQRRASRSPTKMLPGSFAGSEDGSDLGTKTYHHPIPGLSSTAGSDYTEERRKKRNGGYRKGEVVDD